MVRPSGLEPPTPTMSRWCSNQLSYGRIMVRLIGLEPTTPTMSRWCSNQLSYKRIMVRSIGLEPTTPTMSRWCSNQLSYERMLQQQRGRILAGGRGCGKRQTSLFFQFSHDRRSFIHIGYILLMQKNISSPARENGAESAPWGFAAG